MILGINRRLIHTKEWEEFSNLGARGYNLMIGNISVKIGK